MNDVSLRCYSSVTQFISSLKYPICKLFIVFDTGLGSAIVIESIMVFSLGAALIFFTCKCATILVNERRNRAARTPEPASAQSLGKETVSMLFLSVKKL